jgi:hypothetical protein
MDHGEPEAGTRLPGNGDRPWQRLLGERRAIQRDHD